MDDAPLTAFLKAQNDYTRAMLNSSPAARAKLLARIQQLDSAIPVRGGWTRAGKAIFYAETAPEATLSLIVCDADGSSRKLLDPVQFADKRSHAAIDYFFPSYDVACVAVGVSLGGSENSVIRIVDVKTGRLLPEMITRTQYAGPSWREDSRSCCAWTLTQDMVWDQAGSSGRSKSRMSGASFCGKPVTRNFSLQNPTPDDEALRTVKIKWLRGFF